MNGQSSAEEMAALQATLRADAELRALYLDYLNLDVALSAVADAATVTDGDHPATTPFLRPSVRPRSLAWHWIAATAACAALVAVVPLSRHPATPSVQPDLDGAIASTEMAISRLQSTTPPLLPDWISPTAPLLNPPGFSP